MISNGYCVLGWIEANAEDGDLGIGPDPSIISQVPAVEDNEPDRHWYGMSFSREFFLNTTATAGEDLMQYTPLQEHAVDPVPGSRSNSQNMRQLATLIDEFTVHGLEVTNYLDEMVMTQDLRNSPLFIAMFDFHNGGVLLRDAIRKNELAQLMFSLLRCCSESSVPEPTALGDHILAVPVLRHHTTLIMDQVTAGFRAAVSSFVNSLPVVDISTIPKEDMTCPFCWTAFDGTPDPEEGTDSTPLVAPCGNMCPYRFGRSCLVDILLSSPEPLCPLCRQPLEMPMLTYDLAANAVVTDS